MYFANLNKKGIGNTVTVMEIELIFKIAAIGIIVSVLNQVLAKADKGEYATFTTLIGIIIVLFMVIPEIKELFDTVKDMIDY